MEASHRESLRLKASEERELWRGFQRTEQEWEEGRQKALDLLEQVYEGVWACRSIHASQEDAHQDVRTTAVSILQNTIPERELFAQQDVESSDGLWRGSLGAEVGGTSATGHSSQEEGVECLASAVLAAAWCESGGQSALAAVRQSAQCGALLACMSRELRFAKEQVDDLVRATRIELQESVEARSTMESKLLAAHNQRDLVLESLHKSHDRLEEAERGREGLRQLIVVREGELQAALESRGRLQQELQTAAAQILELERKLGEMQQTKARGKAEDDEGEQGRVRGELQAAMRRLYAVEEELTACKQELAATKRGPPLLTSVALASVSSPTSALTASPALEREGSATGDRGGDSRHKGSDPIEGGGSGGGGSSLTQAIVMSAPIPVPKMLDVISSQVAEATAAGETVGCGFAGAVKDEGCLPPALTPPRLATSIMSAATRTPPGWALVSSARAMRELLEDESEIVEAVTVTNGEATLQGSYGGERLGASAVGVCVGGGGEAADDATRLALHAGRGRVFVGVDLQEHFDTDADGSRRAVDTSVGVGHDTETVGCAGRGAGAGGGLDLRIRLEHVVATGGGSSEEGDGLLRGGGIVYSPKVSPGAGSQPRTRGRTPRSEAERKELIRAATLWEHRLRGSLSELLERRAGATETLEYLQTEVIPFLSPILYQLHPPTPRPFASPTTCEEGGRSMHGSAGRTAVRSAGGGMRVLKCVSECVMRALVARVEQLSENRVQEEEKQGAEDEDTCHLSLDVHMSRQQNAVMSDFLREYAGLLRAFIVEPSDLEVIALSVKAACDNACSSGAQRASIQRCLISNLAQYGLAVLESSREGGEYV